MIFELDRINKYLKEKLEITKKRNNDYDLRLNKISVHADFDYFEIRVFSNKITLVDTENNNKYEFETKTRDDLEFIANFVCEKTNKLNLYDYLLSDIVCSYNMAIRMENKILSRINNIYNLNVCRLNSMYMKAELDAIENICNINKNETIIGTILNKHEVIYSFRFFNKKNERNDIIKKYNEIKSMPKSKEDIIKHENCILSKILLLDFESTLEYLHKTYYDKICVLLEPKDNFIFNNNVKEKLDILITMVEVFNSILLGKNISDTENSDMIDWSPMINYLLKIKIDKFGSEIFSKFGINIVSKIENGYVVNINNSNKN